MFNLSPLPFDKNSLEPYISEKTLDFHYNKHHQAYLDNLNKLIIGTELEHLSLEDIIIKTAGQAEQSAVFNNAAQVYNHNFFWQSLSVNESDCQINDQTLALISENFGSLEGFYEKFKAAGLAQFGSGWVWLVKGNNGLEIIRTANAENPLALGLKPLFVVDVWEHAYYLDYQNKRGDFLDICLKKLVNWNFIANNLN